MLGSEESGATMAADNVQTFTDVNFSEQVLQSARPVLVGLVAGAGLAALLATLVLASEAGAMISGIVHVTDPVAYLSSLLVIVVACLLAAWIPASRAARVDPMKTLRQE